MSAIDPDLAKKIYDAIDIVREAIPEVAALGALVAPELAPEIEAGGMFLSKMFEMISVLESHASRVDAAIALRVKTEDAWKAALQRDPR